MRLRELAKSAALEVDPDAVRDAPVDHLGNVLHLWAACIDRAPWVSNELAAEHLAWADAPPARVEDAGGFSGGPAGPLPAFLNELRVTRLPTRS